MIRCKRNRNVTKIQQDAIFRGLQQEMTHSSLVWRFHTDLYVSRNVNLKSFHRWWIGTSRSNPRLKVKQILARSNGNVTKPIYMNCTTSSATSWTLRASSRHETSSWREQESVCCLGKGQFDVNPSANEKSAWREQVQLIRKWQNDIYSAICWLTIRASISATHHQFRRRIGYYLDMLLDWRNGSLN